MENWEKIIISRKDTIYKTISIIDKYASQIALVANEEKKLEGTITDGDIRRAILKGFSLNELTEKIMNPNPVTTYYKKSREEICLFMKRKGLKHLPVLNEQGIIRGLYSTRDFFEMPRLDNWVVIMAGGMGRRLVPLTEKCPKPMIQIGNKPILEIILENFINQGFSKFYITVNYLSDIIKNYFGDGHQLDVNIEYLQEDKKLGTSGSLSLLPGKPSLPLIIMNGDILTKVNFQSLIDYHLEYNCTATMCLCEYDIQVPYGVVDVDNFNVRNILEKPVNKYFINAGIYCLEPECLDYVPANEHFDMTTLFEGLLKDKKTICSFPIREYWLDIGRISDLKKANIEIERLIK